MKRMPIVVLIITCLSLGSIHLIVNPKTSHAQISQTNQVIKIPKVFPKKISEVDFYEDITQFKVRPEFVEFEPNYPLWTDGALKTRWVYFPPESQINTDDPNQCFILVDWDNIKAGDTADYFPAIPVAMLPKETKQEIEGYV